MVVRLDVLPDQTNEYGSTIDHTGDSAILLTPHRFICSRNESRNESSSLVGSQSHPHCFISSCVSCCRLYDFLLSQETHEEGVFDRLRLAAEHRLAGDVREAQALKIKFLDGSHEIVVLDDGL
ncbi:hypothetical protein ACFQH2_06405 [Natronoarchaeum sp. GCM10025703]|uniref:hypothetical protein n=1 Tax=Natronoarchaeum sp. GCM10025703 TaxID=3252685 RepID=UPI0036074CF5